VTEINTVILNKKLTPQTDHEEELVRHALLDARKRFDEALAPFRNFQKIMDGANIEGTDYLPCAMGKLPEGLLRFCD